MLKVAVETRETEIPHTLKANFMMHDKVRCIKHLDILTVRSEEYVYYYKYTLKSNS